MKRILRPLFLVMALASLLCVSAMAAEDAAGFYNITAGSGLSISAGTVQDKQYTPVEKTASANVDLTNDTQDKIVYERFYPGTDALQVTVTNAEEGRQYLVVLFDGDAPREGNIRYIDQQAKSDDALTFTVYPSDLPTGVLLNLWVTSNDGNAARTATLGYAPTSGADGYARAPFIPGDANGDDTVNMNDALHIMRFLAYYESTIVFEAANVYTEDAKDSINMNDALQIMRYLANYVTEL